jgi:peptidyl-prolyl cis-trans isomerase B (cyclophilin B)
MHRWALPALALLLTGQTSPTSLAVISAELRGARTTRDLATIRNGAQRGDVDTRRIAVRALGRLERPPLIAEIARFLNDDLAEIRAQAADAVGQAAQGLLAAGGRSGMVTVESAFRPLVSRLAVETDPAVRSAICETIGRLPYTTAGQVDEASSVLNQAPDGTVTDRLGIAKGAEALARLSGHLAAPSAELIARLRGFVSSDPNHDARVRRLALATLIHAGAVDEATLIRAASDGDAQVRLLGVRSAGLSASPAARDRLDEGLDDASPMVRLEALLGADGDRQCETAVGALSDRDRRIALAALDRLAACASSIRAVDAIEYALHDLSQAGLPRGWHEAAHALVAMVSVNPGRARVLLPQFVQSRRWPLRMYAARAATNLGERATLERLAADEDARVSGAAVAGLTALGVALDPPASSRNEAPRPELDAEILRDLAGALARVTVRDVGAFDMVLIASEAPAAVSEFVRQAEAGQYNGLSVQVRPNGVVQVGSGTVEASGAEPGSRPAAEVGLWPHVRGAVGVSGGVLFIDLVDNPQFDHEHTVFAQLLRGYEIIDAMLEGDVIEAVEILR